MKLIFIHGINQSNTTAEKLRNQWVKSLEKGGVDPAVLAEAKPEMAYYADILAAGRSAIQAEESARDSIARSEFQFTMLQDMAGAARRVALETGNAALLGENDAELTRIARSLSLADRSPRGFAPLGIIDEIFDYLTKPELREAIDNRVAAAMVDRPMTVIAHSLGSLVAYRVLRDRGIPCRRLITIGSPLSFSIVRQKLDGLFVFPSELQDWHNFYDRADLVALGKSFPVPTAWIRRPRQKRVDNKALFAHDSGGYLRTPEVSGAAREALAG